MAWLTAKFLSACPRGRQTGFHALADQVAFELSDTGQQGSHHATLGRIQFKRHTTDGDNGYLPTVQLVQGIEQVLCGTPPPAEAWAISMTLLRAERFVEAPDAISLNSPMTSYPPRFAKSANSRNCHSHDWSEVETRA